MLGQDGRRLTATRLLVNYHHNMKCECTDSFTCRHCLDRCVDRNIADRNNAPLAWSQPPHQETVFKPLSEVEAVINNTSPGDMLLFMIALDRKERTLAAGAK